MANPFKSIFDIRRHELPVALPMGLVFFLVITSFWVLKPLKKALFIGFYDARGGWLGFDASQAELFAKVGNMVVAVGAVAVFSLLSDRLVRERLLTVFSGFFIAAYAAFSFVLPADFTVEGLIAFDADAVVWTFYLFGDLFSTLMVASFFAFLNDSVDPDAAKRLYGLVGFGGVAGGAVGSTTVRGLVTELSPSSWMWVLTGMAVGIVGLGLFVGRQVQKRGQTAPAPRTAKPEPPVEAEKGNPAFEGFKLVLRSRYLLSIVAIVGLYELVSTIMDFQFSATIAHYLEGEAIGVQFGTVYAITNWTAMIVQLFLTSFVMKRLGLTVALMVLPVAALIGSTAFLVFPLLWVGSLLNTADNAFSYSINQSAKEALYVPTTRDEKYKAKAFIDMFVQRFAKALAVVLSLVISEAFDDFSGIRWLSLATAVILVGWIGAVRYAGRRFREMEGTARVA